MSEKKIIHQNGVNLYVEVNNGVINLGTKKEIPKELNSIPWISLNRIINRDKEVIELFDVIKSEEQIVNILGIGGLGKSILAKEFITRYKEFFNHIVWLEIKSDPKELIALDIQLIDSLNINLDFDKLENHIEANYQLIVNRLRQLHGNNLIIFDNAGSNIEILIQEMNLGQSWSFLTTSREKFSEHYNFELPFFHFKELKKLFNYHYKKQDGNEDNILKKIFDKVGHHTLTIELISKTANRIKLPPQEIFSRLSNVGLDISKAATIKINGKKVNRLFFYLLELYDLSNIDHRDEEVLLAQFSILPTVFISLDELCELFSNDEKNPDRFIDTLESLVDKGWILADQNENYKFHQVLQEVVRHKLKPDAVTCHRIINNLMWKVKANPFEPYFSRIKYLPLAESVVSKVNGISIDLAILLNNINSIFKANGQYYKAIHYMRYAVSIGETLLDSNSLLLATFYHNIGSNYSIIGQPEDELKFQLKSLKIRENNLTSLDPNLAFSYHSTAAAYMNIGKFRKAINYGKKALQIREEIYPSPHPFTANTLNYISRAYFDDNNLKEAENYALQAIEMYEHLEGLEQNYILTSLELLSKIKEISGDEKSSTEIWEKIITQSKKQLEINPNPNGFIQLSSGYRKLKKYKQALKFDLLALDTLSDNMTNSFLYSIICNNISVDYRLLEKHSLSLKYSLKAIENIRKNHYQYNRMIIRFYDNLTITYIELKDYAMASKYHKVSIETARSVLGDNKKDEYYERVIQTGEKLAFLKSERTPPNNMHNDYASSYDKNPLLRPPTDNF